MRVHRRPEHQQSHNQASQTRTEKPTTVGHANVGRHLMPPESFRAGAIIM